MMDPKRLLDGAASPLARRLLEAGAEEAPSADTIERALGSALLAVGMGVTLKSAPVAALASHSVATGAAATGAGTSGAGSAVVGGAGLGTAQAASTVAALHTVAGGAAGAGLATSAAGAAGAAGALEAGLTFAAIAKWVGIGAVGIATATGAPELVQWLEDAPVAKPAETVAGAPRDAAPLHRGTPTLGSPERASVALPTPVPTPAPVHAPARGAARVSTPAPELVPRAKPPAPPQRTGHAGQAARASGSAEASAEPSNPASTLRAEIAGIERARARLDDGDPRAALREVDRHEREIGRPQLRAEARVLRMEALSRSGQRQRARALARELLSDGLAPPHAARARALLEGDPSTP